MPRPESEVPQPSARGYRIRDFCEREAVDRTTVWRWARKGFLIVSRVAPGTGVRVQFRSGLPKIS